MSHSVAIDPAGFIPTKVNTAHLPEDEPMPPLPGEQWDDSDPLLHSSFSYGSSAQQRETQTLDSVFTNLLTKKSPTKSKRHLRQRPEGKNSGCPWQTVSVKKKKKKERCPWRGRQKQSGQENPKNKDKTRQENQDPQRTRVDVGSVLLLSWPQAEAGREPKCWSGDERIGSRWGEWTGDANHLCYLLLWLRSWGAWKKSSKNHNTSTQPLTCSSLEPSTRNISTSSIYYEGLSLSLCWCNDY